MTGDLFKLGKILTSYKAGLSSEVGGTDIGADARVASHDHSRITVTALKDSPGESDDP